MKRLRTPGEIIKELPDDTCPRLDDIHKAIIRIRSRLAAGDYNSSDNTIDACDILVAVEDIREANRKLRESATEACAIADVIIRGRSD